MKMVQELVRQFTDESAKLAAMDEEIRTMQARKVEVSRKIATVDTELSGAQTAAKTAATDYARGRGSETAISEAQAAVTSLSASKAAFEAALVAINEELTSLEEPRKYQAERVVENLHDRIWSRIAEAELEKARVFIQRAFFASRKQRFAGFGARDNFAETVAGLACCQNDDGTIEKSLNVVYGLTA